MKFETVSQLIKKLETFNPDAEILTDINFSYWKSKHCIQEDPDLRKAQDKITTPAIYIYGEKNQTSYELDHIDNPAGERISSYVMSGDGKAVIKCYNKIIQYTHNHILKKYEEYFTRAYYAYSDCDGLELYIRGGDKFKELGFADRHQLDSTVHQMIHDYTVNEGYPVEILGNLSIFIAGEVEF